MSTLVVSMVISMTESTLNHSDNCINQLGSANNCVIVLHKF